MELLLMVWIFFALTMFAVIVGVGMISFFVLVYLISIDRDFRFMMWQATKAIALFVLTTPYLLYVTVRRFDSIE
ncbi:hypothetical protein WJ0W_007187 [Paenibacillus melissococcoides]|uniref:Uncharacterized protein n=1 Tax=Paenibacillus melissococcoides TaxID=2912268 RepID=A0ABN8UBG9_9BACL|nr:MULTISPECIES: hypothetical protein [Paenibacillus]GIO81872.1 hypothetical protein J6TS7_54820 [Paenibacillus dendritiformis]CAH8248519.1 hypothetical protein WJ0W_007187 [Paenibacillus melissococcoides]CAH8721990.1 hypothetical protein HTL2_006638 [Paenibacillus melissococcoides]CAH8722070.1 hypothetical protein WDD9_006606 [Paenibacillus melissococcoides]